MTRPAIFFPRCLSFRLYSASSSMVRSLLRLLLHSTQYTQYTHSTQYTVHTGHTIHTVHTVRTVRTVHTGHTIHTVHTVRTVHTVHTTHTVHTVPPLYLRAFLCPPLPSLYLFVHHSGFVPLSWNTALPSLSWFSSFFFSSSVSISCPLGCFLLLLFFLAISLVLSFFQLLLPDTSCILSSIFPPFFLIFSPHPVRALSVFFLSCFHSRCSLLLLLSSVRPNAFSSFPSYHPFHPSFLIAPVLFASHQRSSDLKPFFVFFRIPFVQLRNPSPWPNFALFCGS
jgi:hypothetical protein